jgi:Holliday junction resolvase RusA-like endonuclease
MIITIPGNPISKKRPRFARRGKFVVTYNDQEGEEGKFMLLMMEQWKHPPSCDPITLNLIFYMPIPSTTSKKLLQIMREGNFKHIKKPDLDNLIKWVKDCGNKVIWQDDSQVFRIMAEKVYSENPRTQIQIL